MPVANFKIVIKLVNSCNMIEGIGTGKNEISACKQQGIKGLEGVDIANQSQADGLPDGSIPFGNIIGRNTINNSEGSACIQVAIKHLKTSYFAICCAGSHINPSLGCGIPHCNIIYIIYGIRKNPSCIKDAIIINHCIHAIVKIISSISPSAVI